MKIHPAAELFPMFNATELDELTEDIRRNGLLEPIVRSGGLIVDGRNRLLACEKAGVTPRFVELDENISPTQFVISKNILRRHLTHGQRTAIALEAAELLREEARQRSAANLKRGDQVPEVSQMTPRETKGLIGKSRIIAAKEAGVSYGSVQQASIVKKVDPEEFHRIKRGEVRVRTALRNIAPKIAALAGERSKSKPTAPPRMTRASIQEFLANLRREITRRRKDNHDERMKRRWNPEGVVKRFQTQLLDWIEQQLDVVTIATHQPSWPGVANPPHSGKKEVVHVLSENEGRRNSTDT